MSSARLRAFLPQRSMHAGDHQFRTLPWRGVPLCRDLEAYKSGRCVFEVRKTRRCYPNPYSCIDIREGQESREASQSCAAH